MASFDEELRLDAEEDAREVEFILDNLSAELKEKFEESDIYYILDAIVDYYFSSGVLESQPDSDGYVDIDLQKVAEYVCQRAAEETKGPYSPDDVFFVVQADMDYQEQNL